MNFTVVLNIEAKDEQVASKTIELLHTTLFQSDLDGISWSWDVTNSKGEHQVINHNQEAAKGGETSVSKKVSRIVHLSKNKPPRKSHNEDRMREGIQCTECGRWTTCWSDISVEAKKFYLCLTCQKKVKGEK